LRASHLDGIVVVMRFSIDIASDPPRLVLWLDEPSDCARIERVVASTEQGLVVVRRTELDPSTRAIVDDLLERHAVTLEALARS